MNDPAKAVFSAAYAYAREDKPETFAALQAAKAAAEEGGVSPNEIWKQEMRGRSAARLDIAQTAAATKGYYPFR